MVFRLYDNTTRGTEVKANGQPSRMRAHKGNAPTLPQTKFCPLCPAKFTRTTHLHRHLRSHTNERLYKCDLCSAEFTRSDLLTRHKKTCGDPAMHRSRRKSCQACAESKIKCDLQYPCSKCISRGKTCAFINDPEVSRLKKKKKTTKANEEDENSGSAGSASGFSPTYTGSGSSLGDGSSGSGSPKLHSASPSASPHSPRMPELLAGGDGTAHSLDFLFDATQGAAMAMDTQAEWWQTQAQGYEPSTSYADQVFGFPSTTYEAHGEQSLTMDSGWETSPCLFLEPGDSHRDAELSEYLHLFFDTFSSQMPIVHRRTWHMDTAHPILTRAMQACGALLVKNDKAARFLAESVEGVRGMVADEFARSSARQKDDLILAVALLQTISLFHQNAAFRESSSVWHGMLALMIRESDAVQRMRAWTIPDLDDLQSIEAAWEDWGVHETAKRSLVLAYLHDCSHCVFSSSLPSLQAADVDLVLPCDELLWEAPSAVEWYARLNEPGVYGHVYTRLPGIPLQSALRALGQKDAQPELKHLNRFALFVLVHGILRNLYMPASLQVPTTACDSVRRNASHVGFGFLLHNWMRAWDALGPQEQEQIPFAYDAMPFFWLAQVSLFAARLPPEETLGLLDTFNLSGPNGFLGGVRFVL
ncbi:hypothetical protein CYLTODRAFT_423072 [Cylindrobasidium torrendii FP15055 ss-10]|uniref:Zn(2)-C6 fungal-type domain-containing protein n=1 Tax=Cylindrobasidium torrendii FP15055 ss-10 TaxID=1314674 RepID=A0A0D7B9H2_9AGAR|nr:hypothetical protein CYLTODRAFT_423072 [Cylindrobasidium torrendii FP15055 ss-10]